MESLDIDSSNNIIFSHLEWSDIFGLAEKSTSNYSQINKFVKNKYNVDFETFKYCFCTSCNNYDIVSYHFPKFCSKCVQKHTCSECLNVNEDICDIDNCGCGIVGYKYDCECPYSLWNVCKDKCYYFCDMCKKDFNVDKDVPFYERYTFHKNWFYKGDYDKPYGLSKTYINFNFYCDECIIKHNIKRKN